MALVSLGFLGGLAHIFLTESYRYAAASVVAPFDYSSMLWALLLGYWLFGELPEKLVYLGAAIVTGAGLFVIWRERQLGRAARSGRGRPAASHLSSTLLSCTPVPAIATGLQARQSRVEGMRISVTRSSRARFSMMLSSTSRVAAMSSERTPLTAMRLTSSASGTRFCLQPTSFRGEQHVDFLAIAAALAAGDVAQALHRVQRREGCRLHHAGLLAQFALGQSRRPPTECAGTSSVRMKRRARPIASAVRARALASHPSPDAPGDRPALLRASGAGSFLCPGRGASFAHLMTQTHFGFFARRIAGSPAGLPASPWPRRRRASGGCP